MWTIRKTLMITPINGTNLHQIKPINPHPVSGINHLRTHSFNQILMINLKNQFIEKPFSILHSMKVKNKSLLSEVFSIKLEESPVLINRWEVWIFQSNKKMVWISGLILLKLLTGILWLRRKMLLNNSLIPHGSHIKNKAGYNPNQVKQFKLNLIANLHSQIPTLSTKSFLVSIKKWLLMLLQRIVFKKDLLEETSLSGIIMVVQTNNFTFTDCLKINKAGKIKTLTLKVISSF